MGDTMPRNLILDLFYNEIIFEAQEGKIDAFFMMHLPFNLIIENKAITRITDIKNDDLLIPTLNITNKELFDSLLVEYVNKAINVYDEKEFSFLSDVDYIYPNTDNTILKQKYKIKYIMCTLLGNASYIDFEDPIKFLKNRISMLENNILPLSKRVDLGYFETIGARIYLKEEKSPIKAETPYRITGYLEYDDGYKVILPEIYMGKTDNKYITTYK